MTSLRRLVFLVVAALSIASPAIAAGFSIAHAPNDGRMAPAESCSYDQARARLKNGDMAYLADVPRSASAYRFIVRWKGEVDGASVSVFNCDVDIARAAAQRHPWCAYVPGDKLQCPIAANAN